MAIADKSIPSPYTTLEDNLLAMNFEPVPVTVSGTPVTDEEILDAAIIFRAALDAVDSGTWLAATIDQFPAGACGHASELLGRYLRGTLAIECAYVLKDLMHPGRSWRSGHAWLEYDGLIIDITGDQFGWAPVIVTRVSHVHEDADAQLHQPLTSDARWWGIYCAPIYAEALRWIAASRPRDNFRS